MNPGAMRSDSPVCAIVSLGSPHRGPARRGNSTNSSAASGTPCSISKPARLTATRHGGGGAPGGCASTCSVAPSTNSAGSPASAENGDWL